MPHLGPAQYLALAGLLWFAVEIWRRIGPETREGMIAIVTWGITSAVWRAGPPSVLLVLYLGWLAAQSHRRRLGELD